MAASDGMLWMAQRGIEGGLCLSIGWRLGCCREGRERWVTGMFSSFARQALVVLRINSELGQEMAIMRGAEEY